MADKSAESLQWEEIEVMTKGEAGEREIKGLEEEKRGQGNEDGEEEWRDAGRTERERCREWWG